jgi:hypothetical protein
MDSITLTGRCCHAATSFEFESLELFGQQRAGFTSDTTRNGFQFQLFNFSFLDV